MGLSNGLDSSHHAYSESYYFANVWLLLRPHWMFAMKPVRYIVGAIGCLLIWFVLAFVKGSFL
jgi:hypothetical protein